MNDEVNKLTTLLANFSFNNLTKKKKLRTPDLAESDEDEELVSDTEKETEKDEKSEESCHVEENLESPPELQLVLRADDGVVDGGENTSGREVSENSTGWSEWNGQDSSVPLRKSGKRQVAWLHEVISLFRAFMFALVTFLVFESGLVMEKLEPLLQKLCRAVYMIIGLMQLRVILKLCTCKLWKSPTNISPHISRRSSRRRVVYDTRAPYLSITLIENVVLRLLVWTWLLSLRVLILVVCILFTWFSFLSDVSSPVSNDDFPTSLQWTGFYIDYLLSGQKCPTITQMLFSHQNTCQ